MAIPPSSHAATLGVTFSQGETLSPQFADGAFVGEHGSRNRDPLNGYQVTYLPFANRKPSSTPIPMVTDFLASDKTVRSRPIDVALDRNGALIIADDVGNAVFWRISGTARR